MTAYNLPRFDVRAELGDFGDLDELGDLDAPDELAEIEALIASGQIDDLGFFPFIIAAIGAGAAAAGAASGIAALVIKAVETVADLVKKGTSAVDAVVKALPKEKTNDPATRLATFASALEKGHFDAQLRSDPRRFVDGLTSLLPGMPKAPADGRMPIASGPFGAAAGGLPGLVHAAVGQRMTKIGVTMKPLATPAAPRPPARPAPPPVVRPTPASHAMLRRNDEAPAQAAPPPTPAKKDEGSSMVLPIVGGVAALAVLGGGAWWLSTRQPPRKGERRAAHR